MGLTVKQEKFCNKYVECGNASEAYRYAYNCANMRESSVNNSAYKMLQHVEIRGRIKHLRENLAEAAGISALQIVREHQKIAFSDATRIRKGWMEMKEFQALTPDERACIKSVETKQTKRVTPEGETVIDEFVKVTTYDKQKALDSLVEMLGYKAPEKKEISGSMTFETFLMESCMEDQDNG